MILFWFFLILFWFFFDFFWFFFWFYGGWLSSSVLVKFDFFLIFLILFWFYGGWLSSSLQVKFDFFWFFWFYEGWSFSSVQVKFDFFDFFYRILIGWGLIIHVHVKFYFFLFLLLIRLTKWLSLNILSLCQFFYFRNKESSNSKKILLFSTKYSQNMFFMGLLCAYFIPLNYVLRIVGHDDICSRFQQTLAD